MYGLRKQLKCLWLVGILFFIGVDVGAATLPLPSSGQDLVGQLKSYRPRVGDNFYSIGRQFDVGYHQMAITNPKEDPAKPSLWDDIVIPTQYILPPGPRAGIVINLAEMRLYYFLPNEPSVVTFPVGIGQVGWQTPQGLVSVIGKMKDPTWHVPESIAQVLAERGVQVPKAIGPGPQDPLGQFALRLSLPGYLIHGTNNPWTIGLRSSSGCIRLYPEDIKDLFTLVPVGTPVTITSQAYKAGWRNGKLYLEAHEPLREEAEADDVTPMIRVVLAALHHNTIKVDWEKAINVALKHDGIPQLISIGSIIPRIPPNPFVALLKTPASVATASN